MAALDEVAKTLEDGGVTGIAAGAAAGWGRGGADARPQLASWRLAQREVGVASATGT